MTDEDLRRKERAAANGHGDASAVDRERARYGGGVLGFLDALIGTTVNIEGVRINHRGTLREVLRHGDGTCSGVVLQPCQRVSYFGKRGPDAQYTYTHTRPRLIPYEMIHDIGQEGFAEGEWPKL